MKERWEGGADGKLVLRRSASAAALPPLLGSTDFCSDALLGQDPPSGAWSGGACEDASSVESGGEGGQLPAATSAGSAEEQSSSSALSAESSELTDSDAAAASSSSYEAVSDGEGRRTAQQPPLPAFRGLLETVGLAPRTRPATRAVRKKAKVQRAPVREEPAARRSSSSSPPPAKRSDDVGAPGAVRGSDSEDDGAAADIFAGAAKAVRQSAYTVSFANLRVVDAPPPQSDAAATGESDPPGRKKEAVPPFSVEDSLAATQPPPPPSAPPVSGPPVPAPRGMFESSDESDGARIPARPSFRLPTEPVQSAPLPPPPAPASLPPPQAPPPPLPAAKPRGGLFDSSDEEETPAILGSALFDKPPPPLPSVKPPGSVAPAAPPRAQPPPPIGSTVVAPKPPARSFFDEEDEPVEAQLPVTIAPVTVAHLQGPRPVRGLFDDDEDKDSLWGNPAPAPAVRAKGQVGRRPPTLPGAPPVVQSAAVPLPLSAAVALPSKPRGGLFDDDDDEEPFLRRTAPAKAQAKPKATLFGSDSD